MGRRPVMRDQFLAGAAVVRSAVADRRVSDAWDQPSVLEAQTIGSLAGHLARGSVWAVADYLAADEPESDGVDFEIAAEYFATLMSLVTDADHVAIRDRGAEVANIGPDAVVATLDERLEHLRTVLPSEPPDRRVAVFAGRVMRLDDYLWTRIVEQVVHLDDLARSLHIEPWPNPPDSAALVVGCGAEIGRLRSGDAAMIRTLFRSPQDGVLPVL